MSEFWIWRKMVIWMDVKVVTEKKHCCLFQPSKAYSSHLPLKLLMSSSAGVHAHLQMVYLLSSFYSLI